MWNQQVVQVYFRAETILGRRWETRNDTLLCQRSYSRTINYCLMECQMNLFHKNKYKEYLSDSIKSL